MEIRKYMEKDISAMVLFGIKLWKMVRLFHKKIF